MVKASSSLYNIGSKIQISFIAENDLLSKMKIKESGTDQQWLNALRSGDQRAFTAIYQTYWFEMYQVVFRKINNREIAEEIVQDIFTRLWKEHKTISVTHLDRYLFTAVRYEVIDYLRSKMNTTVYDEDFKGLDNLIDSATENTILFNDLQESIHRGLEKLPVKSRDIFIRSRFEYLSVEDIAKQYKLSAKAVEYHLTKALKHIRLHLSDTAYMFLSVLSCYF